MSIPGMTEEQIFAEALEKSTASERAAYLDTACAGDTVLRQRIEMLLKSHEAAGQFLEKPAIQCAAEELGGRPDAEPTQGESAVADERASLDFLGPPDKPGVLGRLGHYEIQEVIGHGGMGIVLRAFDDKLHRIVAIKVLAPQLATSANARKRFIREARAAAAVRNDHVIAIYAVEEARELPYLVMEYVSGESLQQRLDQHGPLELREILRIGHQTACGLAAAHALGLIHRDIKPANILLENGVDRVKITDFGLARAVDDASISQSGVVAGTPQYMAPEQAEGKPVDHRSDLFSLGSTLYAMCTGRTPFRASGTMAVLKRICAEKPTSIRETNPEIPDWLVAIVEKLHAKDPMERFQSAREVADLMGQHLAHVQHPSVVGQVSNLPLEPMAGSKPAPRRRRLAIAAAALLFLLLGGLAATEATGVTNLRATVIRIFTPDGTLVVEVDDPDVKVTIEGDGGLVIAGTGLHEVRLKPGTYKLQAAKNGKPVGLDQELVTITRGDKQVVKVRRESPTVTGIAGAERGAFVLFGGPERKFDTLAESVVAADDGDAIEIRGNGPYLVEPIEIEGRALTLRAGPGFRPTLQLNSRTASALLKTDAPLVLEGIEFVWRAEDGAPVEKPFAAIIETRGDVLHVANCRFVRRLGGPGSCILFCGDTRAECRNSEFLRTEDAAILFVCPAKGTLLVENCVDAGLYGSLNFSLDRVLVQDVSVRLRHNTWASGNAVFVRPSSDPLNSGAPRQPCLSIEADQNVFDCRSWFFHYQPFGPGAAAPPPRPWAEVVRGVVAWRDGGSLYPSRISLRAGPEPVPPPAVEGIAAWDRFWNVHAPGSLSGRPKFQGGDVYAIAKTRSERLKPDDFRLRPDSPGYRAGKDGKDLGADIDLVGPGAAYERWKTTPDYQKWLKDTGQKK